jgi:hypothetical protein
MTKKVRIKPWEELVANSTLIDEEGDIKMPSGMWFTKRMEQNLPEDRAITVHKTDHPNLQWYYAGSSSWNITEDMISEDITEEEITEFVEALEGIL